MNLRKNKFSNFFALVICQFLVVSMLITYQSLQQTLQSWLTEEESLIFLKPETTKQEAQKLENLFLQVTSDHQTHLQVKYYDQEESLKDFNSFLPNTESSSELIEEFRQAAPTYIVVKNSGFDQKLNSNLTELFKIISQFSFVEEILQGTQIKNQYQQQAVKVKSVLFVITFIFIFLIIILVNLMIKQYVYRDKEKIEIYEIVGATSQQIRNPYLVKGTLISLSTMVIAWLLFFLISYFINKESSLSVLNVLVRNIHQLDFKLVVITVVFSAALGCFASFVALLKKKVVNAH